MKLELGYIKINDVVFSNEEPKVQAGVLYLNPEKIKEIVLEDDKITTVELSNTKVNYI